MIFKAGCLIWGFILILFAGCDNGGDRDDHAGLVHDIDGNLYHAIIIGSRVWLRENLRTVRYRNGDSIFTTFPATLNILQADSPKYQWPYEGNDANALIYGRLYTWYTVTDPRQICPSGWHVPVDKEWKELIAFLGGADSAGSKMKDTAVGYWISQEPATHNQSGFSALPAGNRDDNSMFTGLGYGSTWWTSTAANDHDALAFCVYNYTGRIERGGFYMKSGFSVRCVKDE